MRDSAGWTLEQLAAKIGKSNEFISLLERGKRLAGIRTYWALADAFGVDIREIVKSVDPRIPQAMLRFLETLKEDGELPMLRDEELAFLRTISVPGRTMTHAAYVHALALFRATKKGES